MSALYPEWVLKQRTKGTAIHRIKGHYYLYQVSSEWDPVKKRSRRKTGRSLGRITPEGLQTRVSREAPQEAMLHRLSQVVVKEYGVCYFIEHGLKEYVQVLAKYFPQNWQTLVALAYCRLVFQSSIRQMPFHVGHSYLSELYPQLALTDKKISLALRDLGRDRAAVSRFMQQSIAPGEHILIDMTNIPSKSSHIALAQPGYNSEWNFEPQFNLLYIYSTQLQMPAFYRLVPGNIREVRAMSLTLRDSGVKNCILIADKGFHSKANIEELLEEKIHFIIPLRRDNTLINYELASENKLKTKDNYFAFQKRYIWYKTYELPDSDLCICLFLDDSLKNQEQSDYLNRIEAKCDGYTLEKFHLKRKEFGTIALITDLKEKSPSEIYSAYKSRMTIENVFDTMKTILEADRTYMQQEEVLQGWMFVNHIALQWYYQLYQQLVKTNQLSKYSVKDLIEHLREIRMVKINESWGLAEIIKKSQTLLDKINLPIV